MRLTDLRVQSLAPPPKGQKTYHCDTLTGFGVRVSQGGAKTFVLMVGRDRQLISIGRYPIIGLADARQIAKERLAEITLGKHRPKRVKFADALALFLKEKEAKNKASTLAITRGIMNTHFKHLHDRSITEIGSRDIAEVTDRLIGDGFPSAANHALVAAKTFFKWAVRRGFSESSSIGLLEKPAKLVTRERVLSDDELRTIWTALQSTSEPFKSIVSLLLLTGQRRTEIASLKAEWCSLPSLKDEVILSAPAPLAVGGEDTNDCELSSGSPMQAPSVSAVISQRQPTICLPSTITKNKRSHTFPLSSMATALIARHIGSGRDQALDQLLFPARGSTDKPFSGWSKAKAQLDKKIGELLTATKVDNISSWTLHDLRRTLATNWQRLGVSTECIEAYLNHVSGARAGIVGVYQRHRFWDEQVAAVELFDQWFTKTIISE